MDLENSKGLGEEYTFLTQSIDEHGIECKEGFELAQHAFYRFKTRWSALFKEGLLITLPPIALFDLKNMNLSRQSKQILRKHYTAEYFHKIILNILIKLRDLGIKSFNDENMKKPIYGEMILDFTSTGLIFIQHARNDKISPELFISNPSDTSTSRLAGFLVDSIFQLKIPQLKTLNAEQILEVRYKLRDFKEGFTDYVIKLTNDVEALLQSRQTSELVAARKVVERRFETEYNQIRRQIEPLKIMSLGSVLAAGGAFFLAGAVQTTPALLAALAVLYGTVLKDFCQKEAANQAADKQMFYYIATLESEVSKRSP